MVQQLQYGPNEFIIPSFNKNIIGSLDEYFVHLEIIERDKGLVQESSWGFEYFSKRDIIPGRRNKPGTVIQVQDLMNYSLNKIAVYGSPGTGKTTFCKKIVYEFYKNQKMNNIFHDIIWIQLRRLREKSLKGEDFETIDELVAEYFGIEENVLNLEKCLFILDGWDEIQDLGQDSIVINLLKDIISTYKIIVTSRPYVDLTHIFRYTDQVVEIKGFDDFSVRKYIKNVLKSGSKVKSNDEEKILEFLSAVVISDMMSIPILLDIFLFAWEEIKVTQTSPNLTTTKLYELIVLKLWNEFIQREIPDRAKTFTYDSQNLKSVIVSPLSDEMFALSKLARKCFESGDLLFSFLKIDGNDDCRNRLIKTRFLNGVDAEEANADWKRYEFIHLTLCEFFTALNYVFYTKLEEFMEIVGMYKYNVTYRVIIGFMCGLISNGTHGFEYTNEEMLNIFFDCLESEPIDVLRGYHNNLTVTCLNECGDNLKEKRATEICKDLCDTHNQPFPRITSLAMIHILVKNKMNLTQFSSFCLPNLTDNFFIRSGFSEIDTKSKINLLGSQTAFNEASKRKLRELLVEENKSKMFNFLKQNKCRGIPDFFLIYILENYGGSNDADEEKVVQRLSNIKLPLEEARKVCAYFVPTVCESDSIPVIIRKIIKADWQVQKILKANRKAGKTLEIDRYGNRIIKTDMQGKEIKSTRQIRIVHMNFLKNVYEFSDSLQEMLPNLFDEEFSELEISRIIYLIVFFNVTSPTVLDQLVKIMFNVEILRPLIVRAIFHLYYNKWLPDSVALCLIQYLQKNDADECESTKDHDENPFIKDWKKDAFLFRSDITIFASNMYDLVCDGLEHSDFEQTLLDHLIDRLCNGTQGLDDEMISLLSRRQLTISQITKFIASDRIEFKNKYELLSTQTHNKKVTAFLTKNACDMFALDNSTTLYSRIEKDFTESEKQLVVQQSSGYRVYRTQYTSSTLSQITTKIREMYQQYRNVFDASKTFCSNLCLSTFQETVKDLSFQKLSNIYNEAFRRAYLSFNQKCTYITDEILIWSKNESALHIKNTIFHFWNYETSASVLDQHFFESLTHDVIGHFYFQILSEGLHNGVLSRASLIKWISPINIKHLLPFIVFGIIKPEYALYIMSSSSSYYRLCSSNVQSYELGIEDVNFVYELERVVKRLDHPCRQVRKNAISGTYTMDKCNNFYTKIKEIEKLEEISKKHYRTNDELKQFFESSHSNNLFELFKMLYAQGMLVGNSGEFDVIWSTVYTDSSIAFYTVNFGPYHIDLSGISITDTAIFLNLMKFLADTENNVHVLVLSNNLITVVGFEHLINSVKEYKVKHLFLDGNHIYFDQQQFNAFKKLITHPDLELLTLDLSSNFIAGRWVEELKSLNSNDSTNVCNSVKYTLINNCRVIYERNLTDSHKGFTPAIDLIVKVESKDVPLKITPTHGCVGHVMKKQRFGYSGHVLIFTERMVDGQRTFQTAELFQGRMTKNLCKVVIREVDPFVDHTKNETCRESLKNRLLLYNIPKRGSLSNEDIVKLLKDMKCSQDKDNFYEYNISTKNEFANRNNCIKWANDIMEPYLGSEIIQEKIPWFYKSSAKNTVFSVFGLISLIIVSRIFLITYGV